MVGGVPDLMDEVTGERVSLQEFEKRKKQREEAAEFQAKEEAGVEEDTEFKKKQKERLGARATQSKTSTLMSRGQDDKASVSRKTLLGF